MRLGARALGWCRVYIMKDIAYIHVIKSFLRKFFIFSLEGFQKTESYFNDSLSVSNSFIIVRFHNWSWWKTIMHSLRHLGNWILERMGCIIRNEHAKNWLKTNEYPEPGNNDVPWRKPLRKFWRPRFRCHYLGARIRHHNCGLVMEDDIPEIEVDSTDRTSGGTFHEAETNLWMISEM